MHQILMFRLRFLYNRRADHGQANLFVLFNRGEREMKFKKLLAKKENGHIMGGYIGRTVQSRAERI